MYVWVCMWFLLAFLCLKKKKTLRQKPSKSTLFIFVGENSKRYENKYWSLSIRVFFCAITEVAKFNPLPGKSISVWMLPIKLSFK